MPIPGSSKVVILAWLITSAAASIHSRSVCAAETDGLEVTSANLGGPWSKGMLVVQDGRKRMPERAQNFKYIPWTEVAKALHLP